MERSKSSKSDLFTQLWNKGIKSIPRLSYLTDVPMRTAYHYKSKLSSKQSLKPKIPRSRPGKFSAVARASLKDLYFANPRKHAKWFASELDRAGVVKVTPRTIQKELRALDCRFRLPRHTRMTDENQRQRLEYAETTVGRSWNNVWSYDEVYFN